MGAVLPFDRKTSDTASPRPVGGGVDRCLSDLRADYERQGGLTLDDVFRLIAAHRLAPEEAAAVLSGLTEGGITPEGHQDDDPDSGPDLGTGCELAGGIGSHRILAAADEVKLGRRIRMGLDAQESVEVLATPAQAALIQDGRDAHRTLVRSNVRLAMSIARRYAGQGLDMDDLVQEGILGLMRAADKFDYTMGFKFSTYATWWVRQSIDRAIANSSRTIRLPVHIVEQMEKVLRLRRRMELRDGRPPTITELSFESDLPREKVAALLDYSRDVVSLDRLIGEDTTLGDLRADPRTSTHLTVERRVLREDVERRIQVLSDVLGERAADVIKRRFGFVDDGERQTLEQIGVAYGVTRERIRQIESKTLKSDFVRDLFEDLHESWFSRDAE